MECCRHTLIPIRIEQFFVNKLPVILISDIRIFSARRL